jgi:DNA-binding NarL/FixJ family response regulator
MNEDLAKKRIAVCDTQPITAQGLRNLLASSEDLELVEAMNSLEAATAFVRVSAPDIVVVDKGFGMRAVLDWIHDLKLIDATPAITVWGVSMTEAEALRLLQAGARGIVRKTADLASLLTCLRTVASGRSWMEDCVFRDSARQIGYPRSDRIWSVDDAK